jgi:alcohol dehydrogenase
LAPEDFDQWVSPKGREAELNGKLLPQIALPTTLSAAEYGRDIGVTDTQRRVKHLYRYDAVVPQSILLDPDLAAATPARLWSATGIKMMSDAIELVYSKRSHPVLEPLCLQAVRWFATYLPRSFDVNPVVAVDARMHCQLAAWMTLFGTHNAGTCTALGAALRHQLGGALGMPHGEATCVMLPHLILFNAPAVPDGYLRLAEALDVHVPGQSRDDRVQAVASRIRSLAQELGMPTRLGALGATITDLPHIAHHALEEPAADFNPRTVLDAQELIALLEAAL